MLLTAIIETRRITAGTLIERILMLTGDNPRTASEIARQVAITKFEAGWI